MKNTEHQDEAAGKKAYTAPQILSREKLELVAGTCTGGKADTTSCPVGPISS